MGHQSLAGKILFSKNLGAARPERDPKRDDALSVHRHGLDDDRASGMSRARSDVTSAYGKAQDSLSGTSGS